MRGRGRGAFIDRILREMGAEATRLTRENGCHCKRGSERSERQESGSVSWRYFDRSVSCGWRRARSRGVRVAGGGEASPRRRPGFLQKYPSVS